MTSPIGAISGISGLSGIEGLQGVSGLAGASGSGDTTGAAAGPNSDFAGLLAKGIESVQQLQGKADDLAVKAAAGQLTDPAQYTMAANEAGLALSLTIAVRNKAVEAFQEIMRMQA